MDPTSTMPISYTRAAEIVESAAEYMQEHGKCEDDYGRAGGPVCAVGAIRMIYTGDPVGGMEIGPRLVCIRIEALIEAELNVGSLINWSDDHDEETVIAGLHLVATRLAAKESA